MKSDEILADDAHRPWPVPRRPWLMRQEWNRLLFAHWPVDPARLRPLVPSVLSLDVRDDRCWVAVTPFYLFGLKMRNLPPIPGTSAFAELNVRTYVTVNGRPGVYFFSLDAGSATAVFGARWMYGLPYFYAHLNARSDGDSVAYRCLRLQPGKIAQFRGQYRPQVTYSMPPQGHWNNSWWSAIACTPSRDVACTERRFTTRNGLCNLPKPRSR